MKKFISPWLTRISDFIDFFSPRPLEQERRTNRDRRVNDSLYYILMGGTERRTKDRRKL
jgi:hypothetical protein